MVSWNTLRSASPQLSSLFTTLSDAAALLQKPNSLSHTDYSSPSRRSTTGVPLCKGIFYPRKVSIMRSAGDSRFFPLSGRDYDVRSC